VKVAAVQHDIVWEDPPATFAHVAPLIDEAASEGARLVLLSEMFATGFSMETDRIAEPVDGPSAQFLLEQAAKHDAWIGGSVPERPAGEPLPYNTFVLATPDGTVHRYRKIHPFSYAREHERFGAGAEHVTVDIQGVRCSLFVCYDLRFADEFWALARDTDCFLVVANWPESRREHWRALLVARAIENQSYVVGVNRVGAGGGLEYAGDSRIIDPLGEVLAEAEHAERVLVADVDPARVRQVRTKFPFLADRR
jgi:predicted amidohydrolase